MKISTSWCEASLSVAFRLSRLGFVRQGSRSWVLLHVHKPAHIVVGVKGAMVERSAKKNL